MESRYIPPPENASNLKPSEARSIFRRNGYYGTTSGFCLGYLQANVVILPAGMADEFEEFCRKNPVPLPLLYRSKPGECSASPIAKNSDVKTDLPRYIIFSGGKQVEDTLDLCGFEKSWDDLVTFYLGCSFTFESALSARGIKMRNMESGKNVSMYLSNIQLKKVGLFGAKMVVSMRPIKKAQLSEAFIVSSQYPDSHGSPIHIGGPTRIGVVDIGRPYAGDVSSFEGDEVPVFWGCGVTIGQAVMAAAPQLSFTHYSGSMFITDIRPEPKPVTDKIDVVELSRKSQPFFASILEDRSIDVISKMEKAILEDPRKRGIVHLYQESDLLKAVLTLSHAKKVAIATGSPVEVIEEADALPGALSICQALLALDKEVVLIADSGNVSLHKSCVDHMTALGALRSSVEVISCSEAMEIYKGASLDAPVWNCLVTIRRAGRTTSDGTHRTVNAKTLSMESLDDIFTMALSNSLVSTIAIGDGGNELGMGKVYERVASHIPRGGDTIASVTACDYLIAAGMPSWAGYAVSLGLYAASCSPMHWKYRNYGIDADNTPKFEVEDFLPSINQISELLRYMNELGISDGMMSKNMDQFVGKITELKDCMHINLSRK